MLISKPRINYILASLLFLVLPSLSFADTPQKGHNKEAVQRAVEDYQSAKDLLNVGKSLQAQKMLEEVLEIVPEFHNARLKLVEIYQQQGKISEANQLLKAGLALDSEQPELIKKQEKLNVATPKDQSIASLATRYKEAIQLNDKGEVKKAKKLLQEVLEQAPAFHPARVILAKIYLKEDKNIEADVLLTKGLTIDENNPDFQKLKEQIQIAKAPRATGAVHAAKVEVDFKETPVTKQAVPLSKAERAAFQFKKAQYEETQGHYNEAMQRYKKVLEKVPSYHPARIRLVEIYQKNGMQGEALNTLLEGLRIDSDQPAYIMQVAHAYLQQSQPKEALDWLLKMPEKSRSSVSYSSILALSYLQRGRYDSARREYQKLTVLESRDSRWWLGLALAHEKLGQNNAALKGFERAKKIGHLDSDVLQYVNKKIDELSKD